MLLRTKLLALVCAVAAAVLLMGMGDPKPRLTVTVNRAATAVWVKWTVTAPGNPEQVRVTITASGQATVVRTYGVSSKTDSVSFPAPLPAQTIAGTVTPESTRRGLTTSGDAVNWTYTEPDIPPPPPSVTVEVFPASATVPPGGSQQFTVTVSPTSVSLAPGASQQFAAQVSES